jgi:Flp pilus assembly protein TadG
LARWLAVLRQESGANVIEMAFIAMFMFVLVAGIVDLGGAFQNYIIVINSSREGARLYARLPCTSTNRAAVKSAVVTAARGEAANSNVSVPAGNVTLSPDPSSACPAAGGTVRVTVQVNYQTLMGKFWGATSFPIRSQTSMMFYGTD